MISDDKGMRPVSGSVNLARTYDINSMDAAATRPLRTKLFTTSLIDFSGATPILRQVSLRERAQYSGGGLNLRNRAFVESGDSSCPVSSSGVQEPSAERTFMSIDHLCAMPRIFVQDLADHIGSLILNSGFDLVSVRPLKRV
jgi:hypothetical protein